jgi:hypothetical protein
MLNRYQQSLHPRECKSRFRGQQEGHNHDRATINKTSITLSDAIAEYLDH